MGSVPKNKLGAANGITQLVKNLGMVIGIAFSVALLSTFMGRNPVNYSTAFIRGAQKVYYIAAVLSLIGAIVSGIRNKKKDPAA